MAVGGGFKSDQLGVLLSGMSASTAAMVLGRSTAWVQARWAELVAEPEREAASVAAEPAVVADFGCGPGVDPEAGVNLEPAAPATSAMAMAIVPAASTSVAWRRPGAGVERLRVMTPARLRFCRWFLAAGWRVHEVADLFDLDVERLVEALP